MQLYSIHQYYSIIGDRIHQYYSITGERIHQY